LPYIAVNAYPKII